MAKHKISKWLQDKELINKVLIIPTDYGFKIIDYRGDIKNEVYDWVKVDKRGKVIERPYSSNSFYDYGNYILMNVKVDDYIEF